MFWECALVLLFGFLGVGVIYYLRWIRQRIIVEILKITGETDAKVCLLQMREKSLKERLKRINDILVSIEKRVSELERKLNG